MTRRRALTWILLFALAAVVGTRDFGGGGDGGSGRERERGRDAATYARGARLRAVVTRIVDGDTVKVRIGDRLDTVRYIGVDTPETKKPGTPVQCFGKAASAYNDRLVTGEAVDLRLDAEARDRYGRLLAYVYRRRDGLFVNAALARGGYATTLTIPPNVAHAGLFLRLTRAARDAGRGLWSSCPRPFM